MPYPSLLHPEPLSLRQSTADPYLHRRHSNTVPSQSLWGPWVLVCIRFVWAFWASLAGMGFEFKREFAPPTVLLGFSFTLVRGVSPHSRSSAHSRRSLQTMQCYWALIKNEPLNLEKSWKTLDVYYQVKEDDLKSLHSYILYIIFWIVGREGWIGGTESF